MKIKVMGIVLFMGSLVWSCEVVYPDFERFVPEGDISAMVIRTKHVSSTATEIVYDTELQFMEKYFSGDNSSVIKSDFKPDQYTTILDVNPVYYDGTKQANVIFLIDQSKSYEETDPYNARSQLISKFAEEFAGQDFMIGGFSKDGELDAPVEFINEDANWDLYVKEIFDMAKRSGGSSSLYDALDEAMKTFTPNSAQKQIVVLTQSSDQSSSNTLPAIISKANLQNVRIHIVSLGAVTHVELAQLSQQTDGFYSACTTDKQMIQALNNLNRNITGSSVGVKVRVKVTPPGGVTPGTGFLHSLVVEDYIFEKDYNTVYPFVKIP
jgi:hypothetical protein